jgi:hypothetical protein
MFEALQQKDVTGQGRLRALDVPSHQVTKQNVRQQDDPQLPPKNFAAPDLRATFGPEWTSGCKRDLSKTTEAVLFK